MGLQGCCGCMSLKEGSKAIGITYLVLSVLSAVTNTWGFVKYAHDHPAQPLPVWAYVISYGLILLCIVFNSLLIQGVNSSSRGMVLVWLIFHGIIQVFQSLAIVALIIAAIVYNTPLCLGAAIVAGLVVLFWYWYVVVLTHYNEMRSNDGFVYQQHAMEKQ